MFIPRKFHVTDEAEIVEFIQSNGFGVVISTDQGRPIGTHIPFQIKKFDDGLYLTSHMAKINPQWKTFEAMDEVLVIFQGAHSYVSSSWYQHENAPTWNYQNVHVYGKIELMTERELAEDLTTLLHQYEDGRDKAVLWETMSDGVKRQIKAIVGFKIKITEFQAAYKLSQNRNAVDYQGIIEKLETEGDAHSTEMAKVMKKYSPYDE